MSYAPAIHVDAPANIFFISGATFPLSTTSIHTSLKRTRTPRTFSPKPGVGWRTSSWTRGHLATRVQGEGVFDPHAGHA
jgi:hypothetical protein